jgi:hypothetical protein
MFQDSVVTMKSITQKEAYPKAFNCIIILCGFQPPRIQDSADEADEADETDEADEG